MKTRRANLSSRPRERQGPAKRERDIRQAGLPVEVLQQTKRSADLALVYDEAWERGPAWQVAIRVGAGMLPEPDADRLKAVLIDGAKKNREDIELSVWGIDRSCIGRQAVYFVRSGADKQGAKGQFCSTAVCYYNCRGICR